MAALERSPAVAELLAQFPDVERVAKEHTVSLEDFEKHVHRNKVDGVEGGAVGVIWLPDGRIPLVRRSKTLAGWALPSGGIERGDSYIQTLTREMHEEIGVKLVPDSIRAILFEQQTLVAPDGRRYTQNLVTFDADVLPGSVPHETAETRAEGLTLALFSLDALPELIFTDRDKIVRSVKLRSA